MKVWVVCVEDGYSADSIWTTREKAVREAKRLEWDENDQDRFVQEWEIDKPGQANEKLFGLKAED